MAEAVNLSAADAAAHRRQIFDDCYQASCNKCDDGDGTMYAAVARMKQKAILRECFIVELSELESLATGKRIHSKSVSYYS